MQGLLVRCFGRIWRFVGRLVWCRESWTILCNDMLCDGIPERRMMHCWSRSPSGWSWLSKRAKCKVRCRVLFLVYKHFARIRGVGDVGIVGAAVVGSTEQSIQQKPRVRPRRDGFLGKEGAISSNAEADTHTCILNGTFISPCSSNPGEARICSVSRSLPHVPISILGACLHRVSCAPSMPAHGLGHMAATARYTCLSAYLHHQQ